jgi:hypothetical protein
MLACNPKFVLRNHLAQKAIEQAQEGHFHEVHRLLEVLMRPYDEQCGTPGQGPGTPADALPAPRGFACMEVSCSS